jgi:hypothetical protein
MTGNLVGFGFGPAERVVVPPAATGQRKTVKMGIPSFPHWAGCAAAGKA